MTGNHAFSFATQLDFPFGFSIVVAVVVVDVVYIQVYNRETRH